MKGVDTMPSSINFNGVRTFRPGVYAVIDASALGGSGVSTGNVAVIGDFPLLAQHTPTSFESARAMSDYFLGDTDMQLLAKIAFSPATDDRVGGGASQLFVVNASSVSQAQHIFRAQDGSASLLVKSKLHGKSGNTVSVGVSPSVTAEGTLYNILIKRDGLSEAYNNVGSGPLFSVQFAGGGSASMSGGPAGVTITESFTAASEQGETVVQTVFSLPSPKKVALTPEAAHNQDITIVVSGKDSAGDNLAETVTIPSGSDDTVLTANLFAEVSTCTVGNSGANRPVISITSDIAELSASDYSSLAAMVDALDAVPSVTAIKQATNLSTIPSDQLDAFVFADIKADAKSPVANLYAIIRELSDSRIVVASRFAGATKPPLNGAGGPLSATLSGGTHTIADTTGYTTALESILAEDVQIVVPMDQNLAVHQAVLQHCKDSQLYGRERNAYVGAPAKTSLKSLFDSYSSKLNSRHVSLVGQSIKFSMPDGSSKVLDPKFLALMCACMQAGTSAAVPLTRKRPAVLSVEQHAEWNIVRNANEAIRKGILALSLDNLGLRIERSVTTYMTDDNPIFSEVSANESINTSVRTLRARLATQIGNPVISGSRAQIESAVKVSLSKQVKDGVIKAFQNVTITDLGDRFDISYEVAAVEPLNFIKITANVVRIPG